MINALMQQITREEAKSVSNVAQFHNIMFDHRLVEQWPTNY